MSRDDKIWKLAVRIGGNAAVFGFSFAQGDYLKTRAAEIAMDEALSQLRAMLVAQTGRNGRS